MTLENMLFPSLLFLFTFYFCEAKMGLLTDIRVAVTSFLLFVFQLVPSLRSGSSSLSLLVKPRPGYHLSFRIPGKKQAMTLENILFPSLLFLFTFYFCKAKMAGSVGGSFPHDIGSFNSGSQRKIIKGIASLAGCKAGVISFRPLADLASE